MTQTDTTTLREVGAPHSRISSIDGLRGVAVLAVLLFHTQSSFLNAGFLGVDVFFVISGFLIADILYRSGSRSSIGRFWLRRARRLAPALILLLAVVALVRLLRPLPGNGDNAPILAALTYTTNWYDIWTAGSYFASFDHPSVLLHTWSLAIEEQFYLLFPFVLLAATAVFGHKRRAMGAAVAALAGISAGWAALLWVTGASVDRIYMGTDTRAQSLLVGACMGIVVSARPRMERAPRMVTLAGTLGFVLLAAAMAAVRDVSAMFLGGFLVVAMGTAAVILACLYEGPVSRALAWRPLVLLGIISYSVYLWHYPIFAWVQGPEGNAQLSAEVWSFVLTLLVATGSYYFIERPFLRGRFARLPSRRQWLTYLVAALAIVLLALPPAGWLSRRESLQWPERQDVPGSILVMGDSVALGLDLYFPRDRYTTEILGTYKIGCGFSELPFKTNLGVFPVTECQEWKSKTVEYLTSHDPEAVVIESPAWVSWPRIVNGVSYPPGTPPFDDDFQRTLANAIAVGGGEGRRPVYVVKLGCMKAPGTQSDVAKEDIDIVNGMIDEVVDEAPLAHTVDPSFATCTQNRSIDVVGGVAMRDDGMHWTPQGAEWLWHKILTQMAQDRPRA